MMWSTDPLCPECVPESGETRRRYSIKAAEVGGKPKKSGENRRICPPGIFLCKPEVAGSNPAGSIFLTHCDCCGYMDAPAQVRRGGVHVTLHVRGVIPGGIERKRPVAQS